MDTDYFKINITYKTFQGFACKVRKKSQYIGLLHSIPKEDIYAYNHDSAISAVKFLLILYSYSFYILAQQEHKYNKSALKQSD